MGRRDASWLWEYGAGDKGGGSSCCPKVDGPSKMHSREATYRGRYGHGTQRVTIQYNKRTKEKARGDGKRRVAGGQYIKINCRVK